jgi:hypothetical protein
VKGRFSVGGDGDVQLRVVIWRFSVGGDGEAQCGW